MLFGNGLWQKIAGELNGINFYSVTLRLILATLCGGIIGYERGRMNRAAGFRTHMLVCIGSALAMLTNQYALQTFHTNVDVTRIGAQVISGIGFLGAGTIIVTHDRQVKGLTTAAGLWASACMGLAIGIGFYEGALLGCLFIFCVITAFHRIDVRVKNRLAARDLYIEMDGYDRIRGLLELFHQNNLKIYSYELKDNTSVNNKGAVMLVSVSGGEHHDELLNTIGTLEGIYYVDEIG